MIKAVICVFCYTGVCCWVNGGRAWLCEAEQSQSHLWGNQQGQFLIFIKREKKCFKLYIKHEKECFIWYWNIEKLVKKPLAFTLPWVRVGLRTSWRSMFLQLLSDDGQNCLVVGRFKIPFKGWAEASLAKFCAPIWCAEVTCRSSVLQVDTCSATLQKITSFLRKLLLYFRWYRLGRRLQFII